MQVNNSKSLIKADPSRIFSAAGENHYHGARAILHKKGTLLRVPSFRRRS